MTQPGHQQGNIPSSYDGTPPVQNFAAPAHHLSTEQSKDIVALAEASHQDTQGGFMGQNTTSGTHGSGLTGSSGTGFGSNRTEGLANTLGSERRGDDLTGNRSGLTSGTGLGSSNYDSNNTSSSHSHGLGAGAAGAGAGAAGAGVYGSGIGSHGDSNARGGASAVDAKQNQGRGGELTDHEFRNTAPSGTLENKLQDELERNARKAGTHATGFGVQGAPAGSASLGSGTHSGLTGGNTTGYAAPGQQYAAPGQQYGSSGHHTSSAAPLAGAAGATAVGTGAGYGATHGGLSGQQGYASSDPAAPGSGGHLADQIHGLGTQRDTEVGHFGTMQDHKRSNTEAAHLPGSGERRL